MYLCHLDPIELPFYQDTQCLKFVNLQNMIGADRITFYVMSACYMQFLNTISPISLTHVPLVLSYLNNGHAKHAFLRAKKNELKRKTIYQDIY